MPAVANILSIDLRSNPPQQQRGNEDESFSSLLPANSDDNQNEAPKISRRDEQVRPDRSERPPHTRGDRGRENVRFSKKDHVKPDVQKSDNGDVGTDESISSDDVEALDPTAETNNQQASADTPVDPAVSVSTLATPVADVEIQITADLNLTLSAAIAAPTQSDTNANQGTPSQNADTVADINVTPVDALVAAVENAATVTSSTGAKVEATTTTGVAAASVEAGAVIGGIAAVDFTLALRTDTMAAEAASTPTVATDPAFQITAAAMLTADAAKPSVKAADAKPAQGESTDTNPIDLLAKDATTSEIFAAVDSKSSGAALKSDTPVKVAQVASSVIAQGDMTKLQATVGAISKPGPDAKQIVVSDGSHLAVKANEEALVDFTANTLKFDPTLVRYVPSVNAPAVTTAPTTLNPASTQFLAHAAGTADQPVPATIAAIAVAIAARAKDGSRQFEIRLDPPELGRIDVRLDVSKSGEVSTRLTADRQDTLDLLQRDHRGLEKALESAGLKSAEGDVSFSLRQQTPDGSANDRTQMQIAQNDVILVEDNEQTAASIDQYQWAARLRGGVDIRI